MTWALLISLYKVDLRLLWATLRIVLKNFSSKLAKVDSSLVLGIYTLFIQTQSKEIKSLVFFVYIPAD